jgi:hypothetical protein
MLCIFDFDLIDFNVKNSQNQNHFSFKIRKNNAKFK